ncbi:alanine racemase [Arthrobacter sp. RIT-PI-e]|uniref:alanine racemase n=1 Tax=Arthrobacter sp. RIT-PI-e TaxID=1681197 RepID=UPI0006763DD5|nr:alanine racemase [Arthrobacter sp. RIT-PI-e]KNC17254.1 alanine racemase [Arthrobacter sp. RIT-PI-e]
MTVPTAVATPAVVIDAMVLERNIASMAQSVRERGLALRPHAKTHKIPEIARLQVEAGATGITVATIGEAEVFADAGIDDVFIAYPLWVDAPAAARLLALADRIRISVGVDSADGARQLASNLGAGVRRIPVRVELDSGHHRSGVLPDGAVAAASAARSAGLTVAGVFTFPGHSYGPGAAAPAVADEQDALSAAVTSLQDAGFTSLDVSGGSTPSAHLTAGGAVTELRPGVYVFGDAQQWELGHCRPQDIALTVLTTVVSLRPGADGAPDRFVVDAGSKVLGSDRAAWATGHGRLLGNPPHRVALSEPHPPVGVPHGEAPPPLGSRLRAVPNRVCLTVNRADEVLVVRNGAVEAVWTVAARGRNS